MTRIRVLSPLVLAAVAALALPPAAVAVTPAVAGVFSVLTHNIAGLPEGLSAGLIVNLQENFNHKSTH